MFLSVTLVFVFLRSFWSKWIHFLRVAIGELVLRDGIRLRRELR